MDDKMNEIYRYSNNIPDKEGFYWLNDGDFEGVVEVFNMPEKLVIG